MQQTERSQDSARRRPRRFRRAAAVVVLIAVAGIAGIVSYHRGAPVDDGVPSAAPLADTGTIISAPPERWGSLDDPAAEGWDTEVFNTQAGEQFKALAKLLTHPGEIDTAAVAGIVAEDFAGRSLVPASLLVVFDDGSTKVERPGGEDGVALAAGADPIRGRDGLAAALRQLASPFAGARGARAKFKIFRVEEDGRYVTTRQYFSLSGETGRGMLEQNATWLVRWQRGTKGGLPSIARIEVERFEQVSLRDTGGPLFEDWTAAVLAGTDCYRKQLLLGTNHWMRRIPGPFSAGLQGFAVGDVTGDGLEDLYVCQLGGLPNRLLVQRPDGSLADESSAWGVDWLADSRGVLLVDLDNDGDQDLAVTVEGGLLLAANCGDRFELRTVLDTDDDTMSLAAADFDNDGRLDLFVCAYLPTAYDPEKRRESARISGLAAAASGVVYHDAKSGGRNRLFRNTSKNPEEWAFQDVTAAVGLDADNQRFSYAASWEDFDNDGDQDLYVGNDFGQNALYRNELTAAGERRLVDVTESVSAADRAFGMGITWADYDRNGWMDVYVSNMYSSAGNRIAFQDRFRAEGSAELRRAYQFLARGNTLLQGSGDGRFADVSEEAGVTMGRWAWSSNFADLNNDGWDDLLVANGYVTGDDPGDL